jgi:hypothetical protein
MTDTNEIQRHVAAIVRGLDAARDHHARIVHAMNAIEEQGMYPAVPSECWEAKEKDGPLGGRRYTDVVRQAWRHHAPVTTPLAGLGGIGKQIAWLRREAGKETGN